MSVASTVSQTAALTQMLGQFVADPPFQEVPSDVLPVLRNAFVDTVACLYSGVHEPVTQAALALVRERGSRAQVHALLGAEQLSVADAALVNAVAAHALDYDDMALNGHPSVVLVPALLAAGESRGVSDALLLRAYLVGYELWGELVGRESDSLHNKGWHPTSVIGTVAVAAAVAHLWGLNAAQAGHALGIAASMSSGLMGNFGSMTKPLHAGWAAAHGIEAVQLALHGVTASTNVLESPVGFLAAVSPQGNVDRSSAPDWQELRLRRNGLSVKKYPVCYAGHRVIDAMLDLRARHGLEPTQVVRIEPELSDVTARVLHSHQPQTALQAKFSAEFACAMALVEGAVGLNQVTDAQVLRPEVQALMQRIHVSTVPAGCPIEAGFALHDRVQVWLTDGRVLDSGPVRFARGHGQLPLPAHELLAKWHDCVPAQTPQAAQLLERLQHLGRTTGASLCEWLRHRH